MDAVAMDSRARTRSRGYVVAKNPINVRVDAVKEANPQTDVIPASAPLANLFGVSSSFVP
jgi:hypothetical protein